MARTGDFRSGIEPDHVVAGPGPDSFLLCSDHGPVAGLPAAMARARYGLNRKFNLPRGRRQGYLNHMINYDELNNENHHITELSNVLLYLFRERAMCDTGACCELFQRYTDKVQEHIDLVDQNLYSRLLTHDDHAIQKLAKNFMSGSQEISKIMSAYKKKWCPGKEADSLKIKEYERFLEESEGMFNLVLKRIQDETEKLYPLVRELSNDKKTV
jgi:succinate dehydrogenase flavin-adding protein (antitoxin of CptAB toxin-antitoxin module)